MKYITVKPSGTFERRDRHSDSRTVAAHNPVRSSRFLAIVNEVYFRALQKAADFDQGRHRLRDKIALLNGDGALDGVRIADYGTRRRFSRHWHEEVLLQLKASLGDKLAGTSNVMYAAMQV